MIKSLGMEDAAPDRVVRMYLVGQTPWPGAFTMWGNDKSKATCVISVGATKGSPLLDGLMHEAIHALDLETGGKGNVLAELRTRLLKAGLAEDDEIVRHSPHMLVFIQSAETVRRLIDPAYQPYAGGVFIREALQPIVKVELPIWTAYLDGKLSREDAVNQIVTRLVNLRNGKDVPNKRN